MNYICKAKIIPHSAGWEILRSQIPLVHLWIYSVGLGQWWEPSFVIWQLIFMAGHEGHLEEMRPIIPAPHAEEPRLFPRQQGATEGV